MKLCIYTYCILCICIHLCTQAYACINDMVDSNKYCRKNNIRNYARICRPICESVTLCKQCRNNDIRNDVCIQEYYTNVRIHSKKQQGNNKKAHRVVRR